MRVSLKKALAVLAVFAIPSAATAQNVSAAQADSPLNKCSNSELTQDKFLELVKTIAMHGDMTDLPFIEKMLQKKLILLPRSDVGFNDPNDHTYYAKFIFKTGITAFVNVNFHPIEYDTVKVSSPKKNGGLGFQALNRIDYVFRNCGPLTKEQFNKKFGGEFIDHGNSKGGHACKKLQGVGSYAPVEISYNYNKNGFIKEASVDELMETLNHCQ